jgi:hypothetical protein
MGGASPGFVRADRDGGDGDTFAESPSPPPGTASQPKSYFANVMTFAVSILWIALGSGFLVIGRSYARSGNRITATIVGIIGIIALAAGVIL